MSASVSSLQTEFFDNNFSEEGRKIMLFTVEDRNRNDEENEVFRIVDDSNIGRPEVPRPRFRRLEAVNIFRIDPLVRSAHCKVLIEPHGFAKYIETVKCECRIAVRGV